MQDILFVLIYHTLVIFPVFLGVGGWVRAVRKLGLLLQEFGSKSSGILYRDLEVLECT